MRLLLLATLALVAIPAATASAITVETQVTPKSAKAEKFFVESTRRDDGRVEFTITRKFERPAYLVANLRVRKDGDFVADSHHTSFTSEDSESWHFVLSDRYLADAVFELYVGTFSTLDGKKIPVVGGIDYKIRLRDFPVAAAPAEK